MPLLPTLRRLRQKERRSEIQGRSWLCSELEVSLVYMRSYWEWQSLRGWGSYREWQNLRGWERRPGYQLNSMLTSVKWPHSLTPLKALSQPLPLPVDKVWSTKKGFTKGLNFASLHRQSLQGQSTTFLQQDAFLFCQNFWSSAIQKWYHVPVVPGSCG